MNKGRDLEGAISAFGAATKNKLANCAATGAPEDQLRAPLETLVADLAELCGLRHGIVSLVGETTLSHLSTRPDYAVTRSHALIGFLEVKAPGKGADPRKFKDEHDKQQWAKLKSLPNLIYTDGNRFSLWQDGELVGKVVDLIGDVESSGSKLGAPPALLTVFSDFLNWNPIPPRNAKQLAQTIGDKRPPSPLSKIQPDHWPHEYTTDLMDLLNVLGQLIALEPQQAALLDQILAGPLLDHATLSAAGALTAPPTANGTAIP